MTFFYDIRVQLSMQKTGARQPSWIGRFSAALR